MSTYCPVCNGLQPLQVDCPECSAMTNDYGRYNDYLGPYSPYRDMTHISMTNGYPDLQNHVCLHLLHCPGCEHTFQTAVQEILV